MLQTGIESAHSSLIGFFLLGTQQFDHINSFLPVHDFIDYGQYLPSRPTPPSDQASLHTAKYIWKQLYRNVIKVLCDIWFERNK